MSDTTQTDAAPQSVAASGELIPGVDRRHTVGDIFHERTNFQFIERSWRWLAISGSLVLIAVIALGALWLNLGIDFKGGSQWQFTVKSGGASASDIRDVLSGLNLSDGSVLILGSDSARVTTRELSAAERQKVTRALAAYAGIPAANVSTTDVGPTWGQRVSHKALTALIVFFVLIAVYLTMRFEWRMAASAILAVFHDILITAGVYAVTRFEVTPATVIAFLTILGFSLYDTVVVFDKVKDNEAGLGSVRGDTYSHMVNRSLNQVLMRSLNTSFVAVLPVLSLLVAGGYVLGAVSLRDFALALTVGLLSGAYSSIFVATPALAWLKEREPKYRALAERSAVFVYREAARGQAAPGPMVAPVPAPGQPSAPPSRGPAKVAPPRVTPAPRVTGSAPGARVEGPVAPRPRQQRRRKRR